MNQNLPSPEQALNTLVPVIQDYRATRNDHAYWEACINVISQSLVELSRLKADLNPNKENEAPSNVTNIHNG